MGDRIQLLVFIVTPRTRPGAMREVKNSKCLGVSGLCDISWQELHGRTHRVALPVAP